MSVRLLQLRGTVSTRGEASSKLAAAGDAVLVERGRPRLLLLSCPCGCGEQFPINLDSRRGRLGDSTEARGTGISLFPSVWRESGCRSHYIICAIKYCYLDKMKTSPTKCRKVLMSPLAKVKQEIAVAAPRMPCEHAL